MTRNEKFMQKWEETRKGGRLRYALTEGAVFGMILFLIPLILSIFSKSFEIYATNNLAYFLAFSLLSGVACYWLVFWPMNNYFYKKKSKEETLN